MVFSYSNISPNSNTPWSQRVQMTDFLLYLIFMPVQNTSSKYYARWTELLQVFVDTTTTTACRLGTCALYQDRYQGKYFFPAPTHPYALIYARTRPAMPACRWASALLSGPGTWHSLSSAVGQGEKQGQADWQILSPDNRHYLKGPGWFGTTYMSVERLEDICSESNKMKRAFLNFRTVHDKSVLCYIELNCFRRNNNNNNNNNNSSNNNNNLELLLWPTWIYQGCNYNATCSGTAVCGNCIKTTNTYSMTCDCKLILSHSL